VNDATSRGPRLTGPIVLVLAVVLVGILGFVDYVTGRELAVSALYLIPICWGTWRLGLGAGAFLSLVATAVWFAADVLSDVTARYSAIPFWNALMLLAFFFPVIWLLTAFKNTQRFLERTVEHRTAALRREIEERKRLEKEKIQSERLALVGTMAAQVAHEVRNPLGAIMLDLDLVQGELDHLATASLQAEAPGNPVQSPTSEARTLVEEMRHEVHRIEQVITDYLVLARPRKPRREEVDLCQLLERKLSLMKGAFDESGISLRTNFPTKIEPIQLDPEQLWQAVLNLLRNSIDALPQGGTITISIRSGNGCEIIRVHDNGSGIPPEQLERIFVPFATTKAHGTGLGLSLVQQIVNEHHGRVECASGAAEGTTFTITLPCPAARAPESRGARPKRAGSSRASSSRKTVLPQGKTILPQTTAKDS